MTMVLIAAITYLLATAALVRAVVRNGAGSAWTWIAPVAVAIAAHGGYHLAAWRATGGADMHFFAALSLVGLGMALLTTAFAAGGRTRALGVIVFPVAAIVLAGYALSPHAPPQPLDWRLQLHAWCALLAYAPLAIAAVLAILLWLQDGALRRREFHGWMRVLPPLTELESLLFRSIGVGFVLLTATLLTGAAFVGDFFAQRLLDKTILSVLSWIAFGGLLLGRWRRGWRGTTAVRWTLAAMVLLVLAFFGSKFMQELVLSPGGRP